MPEFSFNLIAGAPGSGKTTLAQQIMFALSGPDRSALYFTVVGEHGGLELQHFVQQLAVRLTSWEATTFLVGDINSRRVSRIRSSPSRTDWCGSIKTSIGIRWFARSKS